MNVSYTKIPHTVAVAISPLPPSLAQLSHEVTRAWVSLLVPIELLYFSIYFWQKGYHRTYHLLSALSLAAFWFSLYLAPVTCGPARSQQRFSIAIGTMKLLDMWARRNSLPKYTAGKQPPTWLLSLILLTELRYESFTPNHVRVPKYRENFNEQFQLGIHMVVFTVLQSLPQYYPTVLAFEILLAIYIIWTSLQMLLRYKTSPALFGPLYLADSLTGFWSETWHNAFASPCTSLAYRPIREGLPRIGVPDETARALGMLGVFSFMAIFHMYGLEPILDKKALSRVGFFFFLNGIATIAEAILWRKRKHWTKTLLAWIFETLLASWTASGINIPKGLSSISWGELCEARLRK